MMATFLGLHFFFGVKPHIWMDTGILLMFYALYYGVVARDVAEYCTEKMVVQIGVSTGFIPTSLDYTQKYLRAKRATFKTRLKISIYRARHNCKNWSKFEKLKIRKMKNSDN